MKSTIRTDIAMQTHIGELRTMFREHGFVHVTASTAKKRSHDQNAIGHAWYAQIERELREDTALGIKCQCKLHYGVPILRAEDDDFRAAYDATIKGLSYEQKLKIMEILPVTSIMTTKQLTQYLEAMREGYSDTVKLEFPVDESLQQHYQGRATSRRTVFA